jgi:hypothetical protein
MKYSEIKIVESTTDSNLARTVSVQFDKDCTNINRVNNSLTSLRRNLEKYPEKLSGVVAKLQATGHTTLAGLLANTKFPIQFAGGTAHSIPAYTANMCGGRTAPSNGTNTGNNSGNNSGNNNSNNNSNNGGNSNGGDGNGGVASVADTFSSEMGTLEGLIDQSDWDGAIAFLDANPDFEGAIGSSFRSDIQGKIDADAAVERNRIAQEEAEEAEEAAATAAAEKQAREAAEAAEEAASIAAEEAQARIDTIKAERDAQAAIRAAEKVEADRLEAEAAARREAAEKLERERIEAEEKAEEEAEEEPAPSADTGESEIEEFDWEDLQ